MTVRDALQQVADALARHAEARVDPRAFGDPLALRTPWTPLLGAAAIAPKVARVRLDEQASRVVLRRQPSPLLLLLFFGPAAVLVALLAVAGSPERALAALLEMAPLAVVALAAAVFGLLVLRPAVFDRGHGAYWRGWRPPHPDAARGCRLNEIHALQLLRYQAHGGKGASYPAYQLNLVLRNERRLAVATTTDRDALRGDAYRLQRFLSCKVWDATDPGALPAAARAAPATRAAAMPAARPSAVLRSETAAPRRSSAASVMIAIFVGLTIAGVLLTNPIVLDMLNDKYVELSDPPTMDAPAAVRPAAPEPELIETAHVAPPAPPPAAIPHPMAAAPAPVESAPVAPPPGCEGIPVKFLARCTAAQRDGHACAGKRGSDMVVCLLRNPDPAGLASCAQLPLEQRSPCAFQYFLEQACRNEPDLAAMEACWARERARLGVPG